MSNITGNDVNEAIQAVAKDAMLQKVTSIAITYKTIDDQIKTFSLVGAGNSRYELIGMIDDLKNEAYKHFNTEDDED